MKYKAEPTIACVSDPAAERALVVAAKNGDEQAFETLFKRYRRKTLAVVLRYTRVMEDAEDIVQKSFYKAFVHFCQFQGESSFSTWLTRIAINEALMFLRHIGAVREVSIDDVDNAEGRAGGIEITDSSPGPEASYAQRESAQILSSAMDELTPRMRQALELREFAGLSTEETAERLGVSIGAVKARIFHAKRSLRERLSRHLKSSATRRKKSQGTGTTTAHFLQPHLCDASGF
jgi:RNA polymerase sigma-70 factor (ECF subfamily)